MSSRSWVCLRVADFSARFRSVEMTGLGVVAVEDADPSLQHTSREELHTSLY